MNQSQNLLIAKDIHKQFGSVEVLKGVSLEVNQGELVSIVGASGAGNSTLLYIVSSLEKADKGEIYFEGLSIHTYSPKQLAKYRNLSIGFVFQFHHLLPEFSALENVCIPAWIAKKNRAQTEKRALELLDFMGLAHMKDKKPNAFSGGEQQRIAVARALINRPKLIFADEPTGNLDSKNTQMVFDLFKVLRDELKQTICIVTHDMSLSAQTDRIITLHDGSVVNS